MAETEFTRRIFGEALAEYGAVDSSVVVLTADVSSSVLTNYFAEKFPERFYNVGIAEAGMIDTAVGLALGGMTPFANTFAALLLRAVEQTLAIGESETSEDHKFTLETVACLGACALGPVMVVNETYYGKMNPRKIEAVLKQYD